MSEEEFLGLLDRLLLAHSPCGEEDEIDAVLRPELEALCDEVWTDESGSIIGYLKGGDEAPQCIVAHKDEIGMLVKRIDKDGLIRVENLGGTHPWKYGEGPVQILTREGAIDGVLSIGSVHTTTDTERVKKARTAPLDWSVVRVDAKMTKEELERAGVGAGTRVVIHRNRKKPLIFRGFVSGFGLDDKGGLAVMLTALREYRKRGLKPKGDLYFVATSEEEIGAAGGGYTARNLEIRTIIAIEVCPAEKEYDVKNDERPVVIFKDACYLYDKRLSDELCEVALDIGCGVQRATLSNFGSDASTARKLGQAGRAACIAFPTNNTHGYEISNIAGMMNCARLLLEYLSRWSDEGGERRGLAVS